MSAARTIAPALDAAALLAACPVLPVVVLERAADAVPLGRALAAGGITAMEITLRTPAGVEAIALASRELPGMIVGAGSVVTPAHVDQVADAGARFAVSPGLHGEVVARCLARRIPLLPGIATASELMAAVNLGLTHVKVFPAALLGGPAAIAALAAPFPGVSFLPSGGVNPSNLAAYLSVPAVTAVSGSWMVDPALVHAGDWSEITRRSTEAVAAARTALAGA